MLKCKEQFKCKQGKQVNKQVNKNITANTSIKNGRQVNKNIPTTLQ